MTAREIERAVVARARLHHEFVLPHFTPLHWFECDVFTLSKSDRFTEYEVKISRADFRADKWKRQSWRGRQWIAVTEMRPTKHKLLEQHDEGGPSRFYFAVPHCLVAVSELPEWAGLIYYDGNSLSVIKKAPLLHDKKTNHATRAKLFRSGYYRFLDFYQRPEGQS